MTNDSQNFCKIDHLKLLSINDILNYRKDSSLEYICFEHIKIAKKLTTNYLISQTLTLTLLYNKVIYQRNSLQ